MRKSWITRRSWVLGPLASGLLLAQDAPPAVQITGAVKQELTLTAADLAKMLRATVRIMNDGMETVYEGVWLHEVLKKAGVPQGSELRGKALADYVLAQAADGYQVVFSLGELDPAFIDNEILLADTQMASRCSAPRAGSGWSCRKTNPARVPCEC